MGALRQAGASDLAWLGAAALQARAVDAPEELEEIVRVEPWRVQVTAEGEAAILDRWRDHSSDCAVLALWCAPRRIPVLIGELEAVAAAEGFDRLIGPLVPEGSVQPYLNAGMQVAERVVVMRLDRHGIQRLLGVHASPPPEGVRTRRAEAADFPAIVDLDAKCFDDFWRYDLRLIERLASSGRMLVAESGSRLIGYTLATVHGADGSLGRLAVAPEERRRGIASSLAGEAVRWVSEQGAKAVVLSSQEDNSGAQALYRTLGFTVVPGHLVVCVSGPLSGPPGEER